MAIAAASTTLPAYRTVCVYRNHWQTTNMVNHRHSMSGGFQWWMSRWIARQPEQDCSGWGSHPRITKMVRWSISNISNSQFGKKTNNFHWQTETKFKNKAIALAPFRISSAINDHLSCTTKRETKIASLIFQPLAERLAERSIASSDAVT